MTADEGAIGGGHLSRFQELETVSPVILTTSQLLTTGVDAPTCKNVVIARVIGSMTDFKQIIGRGTRVREDYGKLFFNILDYTGSATRLFADPDFDGEPALIDEEVIDDDGEVVEQTVVEDESQGDEDGAVEIVLLEFNEQEPPAQRKFYFDGGSVEIAAQVVYELDGEASSSASSATPTTRATRSRRSIARPRHLETDWREAQAAARILDALAERGSTFSGSARSPACPTRIRSTCSATSLSTDRYGPVASGPSDCTNARGLLRSVRPEAREILDELARQVRRARTRPAPAAGRPQGSAAVRARQPERDRSISAAHRAARRPSKSWRSCSMRREIRTLTMARAKKARSRSRPRSGSRRPQVVPRHHAQGQGPQRRRRPPADADLDHVPQVPRRHGAGPRATRPLWRASRSAALIDAPYRWRDWNPPNSRRPTDDGLHNADDRRCA